MEQYKEENEKKKEYLKRYHVAELAEKEIQEEIDDLRMNKMFPALIQDGISGSESGEKLRSGLRQCKMRPKKQF